VSPSQPAKPLHKQAGSWGVAIGVCAGGQQVGPSGTAHHGGELLSGGGGTGGKAGQWQCG